jgi:hypothetical protein
MGKVTVSNQNRILSYPSPVVPLPVPKMFIFTSKNNKVILELNRTFGRELVMLQTVLSLFGKFSVHMEVA